MVSPPQEAALVPDGPESKDWAGREGQDSATLDVRQSILQLFPITHNDPTGQAALRKLQELLGYVEPDATVHLRIKSKHRGNIDIRLDYEMKSMIAELITRSAEVTTTQSGLAYRARIKKKTPARTATKPVPGEGYPNP